MKGISKICMVLMAGAILLSGCASVPMASKEENARLKTFPAPSVDKAGLYIYRNSFVGQALKKRLTVDNELIGESANRVFFYREILPGSHTILTESEFGDNSVNFDAAPGQNYFAEQYIKMGVFVGGAGISMVSEEKGKAGVLGCELAK